jgi:archaetidylinositol phosphate synthase
MSYNTWIHKFARGLVRPLVNTAITPNHLTTGRLVFGLVAAVCFSVGETVWNVMGALTFIISMVLDRADGELARLSGKSSRFGAIYDLVTDAICNAALFIGLGVAAMNAGLGLWGIAMGVVAGISISIIFYAVIEVAASVDASAAAFNSFAGFDPDDAIIIVPIGALLGYGQLLLTLAAIITPFVAIYICHDMYKRRQRAMSEET